MVSTTGDAYRGAARKNGIAANAKESASRSFSIGTEWNFLGLILRIMRLSSYMMRSASIARNEGMPKKRPATIGPRRVPVAKVKAASTRKVESAKRKRTKATELLSELLKPEPDLDGFPFQSGQPFVASFVASDDRTTRGAYAVGYRASESDAEIVYLDAAPASRPSSTQQEASVLAVHKIVDQATQQANVLIETSNDYIVQSVNKHRLDWRNNNWKNNQDELIAYASLWKDIDGLIVQKALRIKSIHIRSEDAKRNKIMIILKDLARSGREHHGRPPRN